MPKIEKRICVSPGVERLFTYMPEDADVAQLWPGLLEVGEVQRLLPGGVMARWIYKMRGALLEQLDERSEPLVDRAGSLNLLGDVACAMKWNFQMNTRPPLLTLDADHTYWSAC